MQTFERRVIATLWRSTGPGSPRQAIWVRRYSYFDTAMPRAVQVLLSTGVAGDLVSFSSNEFGFELGWLRLQAGGRYEMGVSPLVKSSPSLLKLMSENK